MSSTTAVRPASSKWFVGHLFRHAWQSHGYTFENLMQLGSMFRAQLCSTATWAGQGPKSCCHGRMINDSGNLAFSRETSEASRMIGHSSELSKL